MTTPTITPPASSGPVGSAAAPGPTPADREQRAEAQRIEQLLDQVRSLAGPPTWERVEELVQRILRLHGAGLGRLLSLVGGEAGLELPLRRRLAQDELVSSLLLLHDLHPLSTEERVAQALDEVRPYLASHAGGIEVLEVRGDTIRLRLQGTCQSCPSSRATISQTIERAIEEGAPELTHILVEGQTPAPPGVAGGPGGLLQLQVRRTEPSSTGAAPSRPRWSPLEGLRPLHEGERQVLEIEGARILLLRLGDSWLAYLSRCPSCSGPLDDGPLTGDLLACPSCPSRFEVTRAGRALCGPAEEPGAPLQPIPLLVDETGARIAWP